MLLEFLADIAELAFYIVFAYALLNAYTQRRKPRWAASFTKRRLAVLGMLTLGVSAIKVIENVVAKESGPVDEAILWFIRQHVPPGFAAYFAAFTRSGSAAFLVPVAVLTTGMLLVARRRFEAVLVGASLATATLSV